MLMHSHSPVKLDTLSDRILNDRLLPSDAMVLSILNDAAAASKAENRSSQFGQKLLQCCSSRRWVAEMVTKFPVRDIEELYQAANAADAALTRDDWLEAFAAHPKARCTDDSS